MPFALKFRFIYMADQQRKTRRLRRLLFGLIGGGIILLVLLPAWFPWGLSPVLNHYGLGYASYDRLGWTRFALIGVHGDWNGTQLKAQRVEAVLPLTWVWRRFNDTINTPPMLTLSEGQLVIDESATSASGETPGSTAGTLDQISYLGRMLQRWLPRAGLTNLTVQVASNQVTIAHAHWQAGRLRAVVQSPAARGEIELTARLGDVSPLEFAAGWKAYEVALQTSFARTASNWHGTGELDWRTNRAQLTAEFTTNSWWPAVAQVSGQRWQIPTSQLGIEGYDNLGADLTVNLVSNRFAVQATAQAQPSPAAVQRGFPVVNFALGADGNPDGINLRTLSIDSPAVNVGLTSPVGFNWSGGLQAGPAQMRVAADLAQLPGVALRGLVAGVVQIEPQGNRLPAGQFQFSANQVHAGSLEVKTITVRGGFAAPRLKLDELRVDLADGSGLKADAVFDVATLRFDAGHWQAAGSFLQKMMPGLGYAELAATGELHGPLTNLTHRGEVRCTQVKAPRLKPFDFKAAWKGQQQHLTTMELELSAGASALTLGAAVDLDLAGRGATVNVNQLSLRRGPAALYALQQPCAITFHIGTTNASEPLWSLAVDAFNWQGAHHTISATADLGWPAQGQASLNLTNVRMAEFSDFLETDQTNFSIAELSAAAQWSNGPVRAVINAAGSLTNAQGEVFALRGNLKLDEQLTVAPLTLASGYAPTLSVTGTVPVQVMLDRGTNPLVWDKAKAIALAVDWQDGRPETITVPLGVPGQLEISQPDVRLRMGGTPEEPTAELTGGATKLAWQSPTNGSPLPQLTDVQFAVAVRPDAIRLKSLTAKLAGQPLTATGEWPLAGAAWRALWADQKIPDWDQAQGRVEFNAVKMAALAAYLPELLAPEGQLSAALELKPGKQLTGGLALTNAATRPFGSITPVRDIAAQLRFQDNRAVLEDFHGQIGGQPIRAEGFVFVPEPGRRSLEYQLHLRGTNVPLSRSPELLLRGDFDLALRSGSNAPPRIAGVVTLHDGLFVQNAAALVWSAPTRPGWRPPYFSITNEPFAHWQLELAIRGDQFLRTRTPVFSGIVSADFQLRGSLLAPVLTGDARVNSGRLVFPFGALTLDQGMASFSGNDPRGPELQINASGRNYRYDIRLEVQGAADGANVVLSATPPLTSEQILLMLTAGEVPQSNFAFSNSDRAGRLGTFLGTDLLSRYLGSDPATERWIFRTGENISGEGRLTYSVEYRLTDRWSIIGDYDEFNAFNANFKWKVFTR